MDMLLLQVGRDGENIKENSEASHTTSFAKGDHARPSSCKGFEKYTSIRAKVEGKNYREN
jgi:hypothetical protein